MLAINRTAPRFAAPRPTVNRCANVLIIRRKYCKEPCNPMETSLFARVEMAPRDPVFGITDAFNQDRNPSKVNLGVGIYLNDQGRIPVLRAVAEAEHRLAASPAPRGYLPIDGTATYDTAVQALLLNDESAIASDGRASPPSLWRYRCTKIGADLLVKYFLVHAPITTHLENPRRVRECGIRSADLPLLRCSSVRSVRRDAGVLQSQRCAPCSAARCVTTQRAQI